MIEEFYIATEKRIDSITKNLENNEWNYVELEFIREWLITINSKMLEGFLLTGDEKMLDFIEQMQALIKKVDTHKDYDARM